MSEARVRLDLNNCLESAVGTEKGVSVKDLDAFSGRLESIHKELDEERRLGHHSYRDIPADTLTVDDVKEYATWARNRFYDILVIGIGGTSQGAASVVNALTHPYHNLLPLENRSGSPRIFFLDNPDPGSLRGVLDVLDLPNTLINVISKSGSTAEVWANFAAVYEPLRSLVSPDDLKDQVVVTTDGEQGDLVKFALEMNFRAFVIPKGVGSRYSVLTPAGLLPAALVGVNVDEFMAGAAEVDQLCRANASPTKNPAYAYALIHYLMDELKDVHQNVFYAYADRLSTMSGWFRQLWAASLGKKQSVGGDTIHVGPTPIAALGTVDQHSQNQLFIEGPADKLVTFVEVADLAGREPVPDVFTALDSANYMANQTVGQLLAVGKKATEYALTRAGRPNVTLTLPTLDARQVGQLMMLLMVSTTVLAKLYEVNPYDQPGVEESKIATFALLGKKGFAERRHEYLGRFPKSERFIV